MKRWHEEVSLMKKRLKRHKRNVGDCIDWFAHLGDWRKKRPDGCWRARCGLCQPREEDIKEKRAPKVKDFEDE